MKRKKIAVGCSIALLVGVAVIGYMWYAMAAGGRRHTEWHECRDICWLFDDAKRICAEKKGLTTGTVVTWQDVQPFFTNSQYWGHGRYDLDPTQIPKCPAGGTYELRPVGYWSLCSIPYHQWANCKRKEPGPGAWRDNDEPNEASQDTSLRADPER